MQLNYQLKKSAVFLFLAASVFACGSGDDEPTTPIEEPDPEPKTAITIPDANFEARLIAQGVDTDGEINQQIWLEDALQVTQLELFSSDDQEKITDLTGIEAFENLKILSVANNALKSVSFADNKALESLTLNLNQLESIDLSANVALKVLTMTRNELESIDLSANVKLQTFHIQGNRLQTLDVSQNTALTDLDATVNELTSITGLAHTKLESLKLGFNYLTELYVNIPTLIGMNVENNELTTLNLDGSSSLEYLLATSNQLKELNIEGNAALKHLKVSYNDIIALDLSNNRDLEIVWASGNELSSLDVSELTALYDLRIIRNNNLSCIKIGTGQEIATVQKENHQSFSTVGCD